MSGILNFFTNLFSGVKKVSSEDGTSYKKIIPSDNNKLAPIEINCLSPKFTILKASQLTTLLVIQDELKELQKNAEKTASVPRIYNFQNIDKKLFTISDKTEDEQPREIEIGPVLDQNSQLEKVGILNTSGSIGKKQYDDFKKELLTVSKKKIVASDYKVETDDPEVKSGNREHLHKFIDEYLQFVYTYVTNNLQINKIEKINLMIGESNLQINHITKILRNACEPEVYSNQIFGGLF
jgi:hypothetical protein